MPLFTFARLLFGLLSLAVLAAGGALLWSWWQGQVFIDLDGVQRRVRGEDWRLWTGLALLAWSALGRWIVLLLIARGDDMPTRAERERGEVRTLTSVGGGSLFVEMLGPRDAPPIVLTHGWGLDSTIWFYAKRQLSRRFRVIAWDLPGLGKSKAGRGAVDLRRFAADLRSVLALAEGRPAVLVGHSIGGMTIQTLARDAPETFERVAGVVLLNTTYTNPLRTMIASPLARALQAPVLEPLMRIGAWLQPLTWLAAWQSYLSGSAHMANRLGFGQHVTRSQLEHTTLLAVRNPPAVLARGNLAMFHWDATGALSKLAVPILVIGGERDIVTRLKASQEIVSATPGARLQAIEGVNHMGFLERADVYNTAIASFADAVQPRAASRPSQMAPRAVGETATFAASDPLDRTRIETPADRERREGAGPPKGPQGTASGPRATPGTRP